MCIGLCSQIKTVCVRQYHAQSSTSSWCLPPLVCSGAWTCDVLSRHWLVPRMHPPTSASGFPFKSVRPLWRRQLLRRDHLSIVFTSWITAFDEGTTKTGRACCARFRSSWTVFRMFWASRRLGTNTSTCWRATLSYCLSAGCSVAPICKLLASSCCVIPLWKSAKTKGRSSTSLNYVLRRCAALELLGDIALYVLLVPSAEMLAVNELHTAGYAFPRSVTGLDTARGLTVPCNGVAGARVGWSPGFVTCFFHLPSTVWIHFLTLVAQSCPASLGTWNPSHRDEAVSFWGSSRRVRRARAPKLFRWPVIGGPACFTGPAPSALIQVLLGSRFANLATFVPSRQRVLKKWVASRHEHFGVGFTVHANWGLTLLV